MGKHGRAGRQGEDLGKADSGHDSHGKYDLTAAGAAFPGPVKSSSWIEEGVHALHSHELLVTDKCGFGDSYCV